MTIAIGRRREGRPRRQRLVAHLFRAFQEDPAFGSAPFTRDQLALISACRIPAGDL